MRAQGSDAKQKILDNMGLTTFEQHYRNARTAKEAKVFWNIKPPKLHYQLDEK